MRLVALWGIEEHVCVCVVNNLPLTQAWTTHTKNQAESLSKQMSLWPKTPAYGFFLAGHSDRCTLLWAPSVFVCVSGDSGHRRSVMPRSALTLYQQFSLHFSTKAMGLPVATATALVFVSDWLFSLFTIGGAASVSCCLDPADRPTQGWHWLILINEVDISFFLDIQCNMCLN